MAKCYGHKKRYLRPGPREVVNGDCRHTSVPSRMSSTQRHDGRKRCGVEAREVTFLVCRKVNKGKAYFGAAKAVFHSLTSTSYVRCGQDIDSGGMETNKNRDC